MPTPTTRTVLGAALALLALLGLSMIWRGAIDFGFVGPSKTYFVLFDDAMVSMRYARNFVDGLGLVWNPGERVEGYTNPLWTIVMAASILLLGPDRAPLGMQAVGLALLLACAWEVAQIYRRAAARAATLPNGWALAGALALGVFYYPLIYWTMLGMEVGLIAWLALRATRLALDDRDGGRGDDWLALLLALAYLTRPDAPLALLPAAAWRLRGAIRQRRLARFAVAMSFFLAVAGLHLLWRHAYYGAWVPNTYTLKMDGHDLGERLLNGLGYLGNYAAQALLLLAAAAYAAWVLRGALAVLLIGPLVLLMLYVAYIGGDAWFYWRMLAPGTPLAAIAIALALQQGGTVRRFAGALAAVLIFATANGQFLPQMVGLEPIYQVPQGQRNLRAGLILREILKPDAVIATAWAGTAPYYAGLRALDILGKTDPRIARLPPDLTNNLGFPGMRWLPGHDKYDLNRSLATPRPDAIDTIAWGKQDFRDWADRNYVAVEMPRGRPDAVVLLLRRDLANIKPEVFQ